MSTCKTVAVKMLKGKIWQTITVHVSQRWTESIKGEDILSTYSCKYWCRASFSVLQSGHCGTQTKELWRCRFGRTCSTTQSAAGHVGGWQGWLLQEWGCSSGAAGAEKLFCRGFPTVLKDKAVPAKGDIVWNLKQENKNKEFIWFEKGERSREITSLQEEGRAEVSLFQVTGMIY